MRNNYGFTLIELILTIALLGIISTISVSVIGNVREKNNKNLCNELKNNIISAAKLYVSDNRYDDTFINDISNYSEIKVSLSDLINNGYLSSEDGNIKNPLNNKKIDNLDTCYVTVTFDSGSKSFSYSVDSIINCG